MNVAAYCSVYGCPKTLVEQCEGYGGKCNNFYCKIHTKLCDRCTRLQHENNLAKYEQMIDGISRQAKIDAWTPGLATLFYLLLLMIGTTAMLCFFVTIGNMLITFLVFVVEVAILLTPIFWHATKTRERVEDEVNELERKNPGFLEAYEIWKVKQREKMPVSSGI
jgi:hypothetical protein